jgi:DNA-binding response OmpR family regulator
MSYLRYVIDMRDLRPAPVGATLVPRAGPGITGGGAGHAERGTNGRAESSAPALGGPPQFLRFGGLAMESRTGATSWRGKRLALSDGDRDLLRVLLRRAGQIVSRERLAAKLRAPAGVVDRRVQRLRDRLNQAGSTTLPYRVNGLGYILWRA